jgi:dTDP-4-amino-4,6-dideoxygalactose transaminase
MNDRVQVPFLDLVTPHVELEDELVGVFRRALRSAAFIGGTEVDLFEQEFAASCRVRQAVGVGSGTDALRLSLLAVGVQPGDTVLTVPNTFIATTEAISQAGAYMDFVDIDERTYTMDPARLREYLESQCARDPQTGRTCHNLTGRPVTAVVPVHLYGQMADMDPILDLADEYRLTVVEDACQAHGAEYLSQREGGWRRAGSMGAAAAFSFYPGKNLGACGEAGAITTDDAGVAERCRMLRDHGQSKKYFHDIEGYNGRLDAIQAGILRVKLRRLETWNRQRRELARAYATLFEGLSDAVTIPYEPERTKSVYHVYAVRVRNRDEVRRDLGDAGIGALIHYPIPLHLQKAYADRGFRQGDFPIAESIAAGILSLPMFPGLTWAQQRVVADALIESVGAGVPLISSVAQPIDAEVEAASSSSL